MSDTPRTDAELIKNEGGSISFIFTRQLERELNAEKTKVYSAWVDMERIGNELEIPLEELSPDAIVTKIASMKDDRAKVIAEKDAALKELHDYKAANKKFWCAYCGEWGDHQSGWCEKLAKGITT